MKRKKLSVVFSILAICAIATGCAKPNDSSVSQSAVSSSSEQSTSEQSASSEQQQPAETDETLYENTALGFRFQLPDLFAGHLQIEEATHEVQQEVVNDIRIFYVDGEQSAQIFKIEEMSLQLWEKRQQEEGPQPTELGTSQDRAVVYYPPQSNPFAEGTDAYTALQQLPEQLNVLKESFEFIE